MTIRAGQYDRQITIRTPSNTRNTIGEVRQTWTDLRTVWAQVIPLVSRDRFVSSGEHSVKAATFRIRWMAGLSSTMRIGYEGDNYEIKGIAEIGRREALEIAAEAVK